MHMALTYRNSARFQICGLSAALILLCSLPVIAQQKEPASGAAPSGAAGAPPAAAAGTPATPGTVLQIKNSLSGEFSYRFVGPNGYSTAPAPLPAAAPGASAPVSMPAEAAKASLEVVDKTRGNVAVVPVPSIKGGSVALEESSFKTVQTVFVTVQKAGKPVTDVLVTLTTPDHKYSMAVLLKASDNGVAQFPNVPMGVPVTASVNLSGHPPFQTINTLQPGHPAEGVRWPVIQVDWPEVSTLTPPAAAPAPAPAQAPQASGQKQAAPENTGGGFFSQILNLIFAVGVLGALAYGLLWAFNNGHIKTLLEKAGVNTSELKPADGVQPSPFDKPAAPPISPITEGTADPFAGGIVGAPAAYTAAPSGPRLVATAGAYSGTIFPLNGVQVSLGRDTAADVSLSSDNSTSRQHAVISLAGGGATISDAGSSNGTFHNGVRLQQGAVQQLRSGDEIQIGQTRFRFEA
jgi:FHA domain